MANYTEKTDISASRFVPVTSRYAGSSVLYYTENKLLTFEIYKKDKKTNSFVAGQNKFFVVTPGTEYRPDLLSLKAYGTVDFWWKILEANNIKDIFEFKTGLNIMIPDVILR